MTGREYKKREDAWCGDNNGLCTFTLGALHLAQGQAKEVVWCV